MRILVVAPRFPPSNAADCHRIRLLLPYFSEFDCEVEILCIDSRDVVAPVDEWLERNLPCNVPVHRVRAWRLSGWGLDGLAQRALFPLYHFASKILRQRRFDLVFFSTTEFLVHILGPLWLHKYGIPYSMDYQDPWVTDYYKQHPTITPPGGRLKFVIVDKLSRIAEHWVAPQCSGFLSVSAQYLKDLDVRYGSCVARQPRLVLPFPAEANEFSQLLESDQIASNIRGQSAIKTLRYIGRGGADMECAGRAFFKVWQALINSGEISADGLRFEAFGTSYDANKDSRLTFLSIASEFGLEEYVSEEPHRLSYSEMLLRLVHSDGLVAFGSDDPAYTASKIYPYLLARRPLLALFHQDSSVVSLLEDVGGGHCVTFDHNGFTSGSLADVAIFFRNFMKGQAEEPLDLERFEKYHARAQAERLVRWFEEVLGTALSRRFISG